MDDTVGISPTEMRFSECAELRVNMRGVGYDHGRFIFSWMQIPGFTEGSN